jgi:endonuclease/exonuclease/phosphatase family metal-dependent hydrolase
MRLTVGTWNLHGGDDWDEGRLRQQLRVMAQYPEVDVWALQEATRWAEQGHRLLHQAAYQLGMGARFLISSNHDGCDLAILVRERGPALRVVRERHDRAGCWWHALGHVQLVVGEADVHLLNVHLAPASPSARTREAEAFSLFRRWPVIAAGDFNAWPADDPLPSREALPEADKVHRKLDRRAAKMIKAAGFRDVAAVLGDRTPTVGHGGDPDSLAYRCDRIVSTLPPTAYLRYEVVRIDQYAQPGQPALSDHCPVIAAFRLGT